MQFICFLPTHFISRTSAHSLRGPLIAQRHSPGIEEFFVIGTSMPDVASFGVLHQVIHGSPAEAHACILRTTCLVKLVL